jgi:hypothetical protein
MNPVFLRFKNLQKNPHCEMPKNTLRRVIMSGMPVFLYGRPLPS